jgi:hypothetical protein
VRAGVAASIFGVRIASSECVRLTRDASASKLSNGFAQLRIMNRTMHAMRIGVVLVGR